MQLRQPSRGDAYPKDKVIEVRPAKGGTPPSFDGVGSAELHDRVREEMRALLSSNEVTPYLDKQGAALLGEARTNYRRLDLDRTRLLRLGDDVHIVTWRGDRTNDTLALSLTMRKFTSGNEGLSVVVRHRTIEEVGEALASLYDEPVIGPIELAQSVDNKMVEKWDPVLPDELLNASFASARVDVHGMRQVLAELLGKPLVDSSQTVGRSGCR